MGESVWFQLFIYWQFTYAVTNALVPGYLSRKGNEKLYSYDRKINKIP